MPFYPSYLPGLTRPAFLKVIFRILLSFSRVIEHRLRQLHLAGEYIFSAIMAALTSFRRYKTYTTDRRGTLAKAVAHLIFIIMVVFFSSSADAREEMRAGETNAGCRGADPSAFQGLKISEKLYGLPGLDNVGRISPCVYRGNQPAQNGYQTLKSIGIKTVINLRAAHEERKEVEKAGMKYLEIPLSMKRGIQREKLTEIIRLMSDPANQPVYIHCALGQDRTGVVVAAYRMDRDRWSFEEAEKEMQSFGFNDAWIHLKKSLKEFAEHTGRARQ